MLHRSIRPQEGSMYLLIELFSTLVSRLSEDSAPAAPVSATGGYHVSPDATLS
jgi:hypothetical protein